MLVGNPELNGIVEEKMMDMWRDTLWEVQSEWGERLRKYGQNVRKSLSTEQLTAWENSHVWQGEDETDSTCALCQEDYRFFYGNPYYCDVRKEKERSASSSDKDDSDGKRSEGGSPPSTHPEEGSL